MEDPLANAVNSKRFARNKSSRGRGPRADSKPFNPLKCLGRYEAHLNASSSEASIDIHELTPDEDGLIGTFTFPGKLHGMFVLAGSRKGLERIVEGMDDEENEEGDESEDEGDGDGEEQSALEAEDERINCRTRNFEKNSFRNPKFWMRWKGYVHQKAEDGGESSEVVDTGMGYLVFATNDCIRIDGTISCEALEWDNVKLWARKMNPAATPCPIAWKDLKVEE